MQPACVLLALGSLVLSATGDLTPGKRRVPLAPAYLGHDAQAAVGARCHVLLLPCPGPEAQSWVGSPSRGVAARLGPQDWQQLHSRGPRGPGMGFECHLEMREDFCSRLLPDPGEAPHIPPPPNGDRGMGVDSQFLSDASHACLLAAVL